MRIRKFAAPALFLLLAAAAALGLRRTREPAAAPAPARMRAETEVDQGPNVAARRLARLATTPEERTWSRDALRLADYEVDLAFAGALRHATFAPVPDTPEVRDLAERRERQEQAVEEGQKNLARLDKALATAREQDRDGLEDQEDVAKAQLELDKDELDATLAALEKLGADPGARVRRLKAAFTAAQQVPVAEGTDLTGSFQPGSLLNRLSVWRNLRLKGALLEGARADAQRKVEELDQRSRRLTQITERLRQEREAAREQAHGFAHGAKGAAPSRDTARNTLKTLRYFTNNQRTLAELGKRRQSMVDLAATYGSWIDFTGSQARAALHAVILQSLWILLVAALVYFAGLIFETVFRAIMAGKGRVGRNLKVVKFGAQVVGVVAIAIIILGTPSQLTTLFGLAGAGLTVALKDFIISFIGWFILVGPKGIHVGDWVEIKGVCGEVVEIGLLRTLLLETGNWSDAGHPTGRVVSFVNSFALDGHFFNFSSSGQWMWDELTVDVPAGEDPYPYMDGIRDLVDARTRENAERAFKEWERADRGYRVGGLKAEPGINVVPTASGVQIRVRYITRAQERNELRAGLNQAVVDLLHGRK